MFLKIHGKMKKVFEVSVFFLLFSFILVAEVLGQNNGDYRSSTSGNWNEKGNWEKYNSTDNTWNPSTESPAVSGLTKTVTIQPGHTIIATSNISSSSTSAKIIVEENATLNMNGYNLYGRSGSSQFSGLVINGNLTTAGYLNAVTLTIGTNGILSTSYPGSNGWWADGCPNPSTDIFGTVIFNGQNQKIPGDTYSKIIVTGSGQKTISGSTTVNDVMTIQSNNTLVISGTLLSNGILNVNGNIIASPISALELKDVNIYTTDGLELQSEGLSSASMILNGTLNNDPSATGNIVTNLSIPGQSWHYISIPFSVLSKDIFSSEGVRNVSLYDESYITTNTDNGWVNYEGYHYNAMANPPSWQLVSSKQWNELLNGRGYNYYSTSDKSYYITGPINNTDVKVTLSFGSGGTGNTSIQGYNLIGNPYFSGIDWVLVTGDPANTESQGWSLVEQAIYFRNNGELITYNGGVTIPNTYNELGNEIPPYQGFFIKSNINNFTLTIPLVSRLNSQNLSYKKSIRTVPLIRLELTNSVKTDQTAIRFDEKATLDYDNSFDARKLFSDAAAPSISSTLGGMNYSINGIPYPEHSISVPLTINAPSTGNYSIRAMEIIDLDNYRITLKDNLLNTSTNLSDISTYSFSSNSGKYSDRFILSVENITTAIPETRTQDVAFKIYESSDALNIQLLNDSWSGIKSNLKIYDLTGRPVLSLSNVDFSSGIVKQIPFSAQKGAYIVEITGDYRRYVGKFISK